MRILVLGAGGFIGAELAARLVAAGHTVVPGLRHPIEPSPIGLESPLICDLATDHDAALWAKRLSGLDAVVNAVGILRETRAGGFRAVHVDGPRALWQGCVDAGVQRILQISALGDPATTEFIGSKHEGDALLMDSESNWTVLRPSVVYSPRTSYGGTSLLRAMAALPLGLMLPRGGRQRLQPVSLKDLADLVCRCLEEGVADRRMLRVVGLEPITLADYLALHRRWLGLPAGFVLSAPGPLVSIAAGLGEWFGSGPLGQTMQTMMDEDNVGEPGDAEATAEVLGRPTQSVAAALAEGPPADGTLTQARLYFLRPLLRFALVFLWIASGAVGFLLPMEASAPILSALGLEGGAGRALVIGASVLDIVLGLALAIRWQLDAVIALMIASLVGYSVILGVAMPSLWLEPFGGLIKNIPLIPAVAICWALEQHR